MKFEWDVKKAKANQRKHGVGFEQASNVFSDPYALSIFDDAHSDAEDRWILLGKSFNEVLLLVVHTFFDANGVELVRINSARKASKKEQRAYQQRRPK